MSETVIEALDAARAAYARATEALRLAEAAARAAGEQVEPRVVDELTVQRINVVEDDGTLRMVIGNSTIGSTAPMRGRQVEHPGRPPMAGLLFVNDEGTECGGLGFAGRRADDGTQVQWGYFTFDDYEQNECFRLGYGREGTRTEKFLEFSDQPEWSLVDMIGELEGLDTDAAAAVEERYFGQVDGLGRSRLRLAREDDGSVRLVLRDAQGRDRLRFVVPADGEPAVEMVDADGVPRSLTAG
ncbi:MAG TPA: hypothetical protein VFM08_01925 [Nocardioides sp.]|jgi:hypothetical protein|nr:hypothetical protein [Nocardioides sp.]